MRIWIETKRRGFNCEQPLGKYNRQTVEPRKGRERERPMDLDGASPAAAISRWKFAAWRQYQHLLDKSTPHVGRRWIGFAVVAAVYAVRVYFVEGFYIVSYGLGIYILNLLIGFLSPQVDPEISDSEGPTLPSSTSDEFRPFVRRLPEFKFWYSSTSRVQ